jgi:hypothetical protein
MKFRIVSLLALATALTSGAYAADAQMPNLNVLATVKITASPGDSIFAAKNHHHQYLYVTHARDKTVDVIDVSHPASPRQLSGWEATRALRAGRTAVISVPDTASTGTARVFDVSDPSEPRVIAEFPNAISATSDNRKLIYVLDENSLRILSTAPKQEQNDDSWFWNAMTPG